MLSYTKAIGKYAIFELENINSIGTGKNILVWNILLNKMIKNFEQMQFKTEHSVLGSF